MGLRCSLLGHDFGDPEVEREREERGSEVVQTVREVAECTRCGKPNVVSENKEITSLEAGREDREEADLDGAELDGVELDPGESVQDSLFEDAEGVEDADAEDAEDDAIVLPDEGGDDGRAYGEWPDREEPDDEPADFDDGPMEWPTVDLEDEGYDARPSTGGDAGVDFGGGLAPEEADIEEEDGLEYVEAADPEPVVDDSEGAVGIAKAGEAPTPAEPSRADVDAEFVCPQCGFVKDVLGSSLRAGDICPDCRRGYLSERQK